MQRYIWKFLIIYFFANGLSSYMQEPKSSRFIEGVPQDFDKDEIQVTHNFF